MDGTSRLPEGVAKLGKAFMGRLIGPGDLEYEEARRVHNGLIDRRPAIIARCRGTADVVDAIAFARSEGLEIAVRGGGHNVAGRAVVDGGLVVDLSLMRGVHVDPRARRARAQGGATWREFDRETQAHGLATTGGSVSSTGIAGLTLGGGLGWLMGRCGLTVDNLVSAEVVTADGRILTASAEEHPDLFWALRGGGGNFGVVASFEYELHPIGPTVTGGFVAHPLDRARDLLRFYRELTARVPDEMTVYAGLLHGPDGSKLAAIVICHCGSLADGAAAAARIRSFAPPALDIMGPITYCEQNMLLDAAFPKGALSYWTSSFVADLSDDAIDTVVDGFARARSPMSQIVFEHLHGRAAAVPVAATAFPHRRNGFNMLVLAQWSSPADTEREIRWVRDTRAAMAPYWDEARYGNYQSEDGAAAAIYGPNYARLREVKAAYDPGNVFHLNQNIEPAVRA
ncbi:MAG TPA: FAD-binding oxidoreductase [Vicinamibacterales bacterium]|nr:FAD-binding oxidoreductase [Vicinamibacterales bacterium]